MAPSAVLDGNYNRLLTENRTFNNELLSIILQYMHVNNEIITYSEI